MPIRHICFSAFTSNVTPVGVDIESDASHQRVIGAPFISIDFRRALRAQTKIRGLRAWRAADT